MNSTLSSPTKKFAKSFLLDHNCYIKDEDGLHSVSARDIPGISFTYLQLASRSKPILDNCDAHSTIVFCDVPLNILFKHLPKNELAAIANFFNIYDLQYALTRAEYISHIMAKLPSSNIDVLTAFRCEYATMKRKRRIDVSVSNIPRNKRFKKQPSEAVPVVESPFPPKPVTTTERIRLLRDFIDSTSPQNFEETGCAVCSELCRRSSAIPLCDIEQHLSFLSEYSHVTRKERSSDDEKPESLPGPVLDPKCSFVCKECASLVRRGIVAKNALANGLWVGEVPQVLKDLTWVERRLIARVRINTYLVQVTSGRSKMMGNVVAFPNPTPDIYQSLPLSLSEAADILAIVYVGPSKPSDEQLNRTPLLVRRLFVLRALQWLKLNHIDYHDLTISTTNLMSYPIEGVPFGYVYTPSLSNKDPSNSSSSDPNEEEGVSEGECPFVVHGLVGSDIIDKGWRALTTLAVKHMTKHSKVLAIGHGDKPESIFANPSLYPRMFPWLFPYGFGGISNPHIVKSISTRAQKAHLLLCHDKRFQLDKLFPIVAFNHEQIQSSSTAGYLLTKKSSFDRVTSNIMNIDPETLDDLIERMSAGEHVTPLTSDEKKCFDIFNDIDLVAGELDGSISSKKRQRSELWSMLSYHGAPTWFITFSPADSRHPIAMYFAGEDTVFKPELLSENEQYRRIAQNPVSAARFFHYMVEAFIKHILGVGSGHRGLFGNTSSFYGTVEQQGRLTLHIHLLLWIANALSPNDIRTKLMEKDSEFQRSLVDYLESCHTGDYVDETFESVHDHMEDLKQTGDLTNPTEELPIPPPLIPHELCDNMLCIECQEHLKWKKCYKDCVNNILIRVNHHKCKRNMCLNNKTNSCKARFPRDCFAETTIDPLSGYIQMGKHEKWLNTFTTELTYLLRCNTDTTSLLTGTAIKAAIAYITDYVSKSSLKTHVVFSVLKTVFACSEEILNSTAPNAEKSRKILVRLVNSLIGKYEIGAPMAAMYLLSNPDHYTNESFVPFFWQSFVTEAVNTAPNDAFSSVEGHEDDTILLTSSPSGISSSSPVFDYIHRSSALSHMTLYDFVSCTERISLKKAPDEFQSELETVSTSDYNPNLDTRSNLDLSSSTLHFLPIHPQFATHCTRILAHDKTRIPNFWGRSLPRKDSGDYDYYCSVMLVLFKPWRTGSDLRLLNQSWSDAFQSTSFSDLYLSKMRNFNLRFECLDARDDFAAQKKKMQLNHPIQVYNDNNALGVSCSTQNLDEMTPVDEDFEYDLTAFSEMCDTSCKQKTQMIQMSNLLQAAGWLKETRMTIQGKHNDLRIDQNTDWKKILELQQASIINERSHSARSQPVRSGKTRPAFLEINMVKAVPLSYLSAKYKDGNSKTAEIKTEISADFSLNTEQNRAFRIVTNHLSSASPEQLLMYLGGMAGTGKSQVVKAITTFFSAMDERYRLALLAPTGTAASLIGGSTYHSFLGITGNDNLSQKRLSMLKAKLEHIDYIFIDEVSMLGLRDLYKISAQLAIIMNNTDVPFGGLNVIFAGDFAQLPPPMKSSPLYAGLNKRKAGSLIDQQTCLGKSLWHQVTTVVILRENMRQTTASDDDNRLRTCLANMRYKSCTDQDLQYLRSKCVTEHSQIFTRSDVRNVSIITALNAQRDELNERGCIRFATDTNQTLQPFVANDSWANKTRAYQRSTSSELHPETEIIQNLLRSLPPSATENAPGTLRLCKGLPVLIKHNQATECCVTNGAEGTVVHWIAQPNPSSGSCSLKTVFVELTNPPQEIQLPGLPVNVVPVSSETKKITCTLPNGSSMSVSRTQCPLLPNFGMTDYGSQGRTRLVNVCHLTNCRNHQSYYTCLSRSSSSDGTFILGSFNPNLIRGGLSGWIRQEFRDLELLDDITRLAFLGDLSPEIKGHTRNTLISSYRSFFSNEYIPPTVHPAIHWNAKDYTNDLSVHREWQLLDKRSFKKPKGRS